MFYKIAIIFAAVACFTDSDTFVRANASTPSPPNVLDSFQKHMQQFQSCLDQALAKTVDEVNVKQVQPVFQVLGDQLNKFSKAVHAFVKREAPATDNANYLENIQKQFGDLSKQVNDKLKETFNPDELKKGFNDALSNINKAFEDLKAKSEAQKKE